MKYLITGVYLPESDFHKKTNVLIEDGIVVSLSANMEDHMDARVISLDDCFLFPGFHVRGERRLYNRMYHAESESCSGQRGTPGGAVEDHP